MKKLIIAAVIIVFGFSASADANTNYAKRVGGYFYTSLSPYGTWIEIGFGTPVWRPTMMKRNWSPYHQGQWIYTRLRLVLGFLRTIWSRSLSLRKMVL